MCNEEGMDNINPVMVRQAYKFFNALDHDKPLRLTYVLEQIGPIYFCDDDSKNTLFAVGAMGLYTMNGIEYIRAGNLVKGLASLLK